MKKNIILFGALLISGIAFSQVGVNTDVPKTTMDVSAKRDTSGVLTDNAQLIGLQAPRLTRAELTANTATYGADQKGALVYITDVSGGDTSGQRANITAIGYYHFDGSFWVTMGGSPTAPVNIYNANGTLTSGRTLTQNGFSLAFLGTNQSTSFFPNNGISQTGIAGGKRASITLASNDNNSDGVNSNMQLFQDPESMSQIIAGSDSRGLIIGTSNTTQPAPIIFMTSAGSNAVGSEKMRITPTGNVGVNTQGFASEKFDVNGIARIRTLPLNGTANAINTTSGGTASASQDQTFTATRTVVADANGVLGYVTGLPTTPPSGSINVGETISQVYSIPAATANVSTFNLKTYVTANSLPALPLLDGMEMNLQGVNSTWYDPRIYNVAAGTQLISYQTFATQVNENETSLNNSLASGSFLQIDQNNIVFWRTTDAEVVTTNLQVQIDANTYRWYEFKWWCMEIGSGPTASKKIFLSVTRKA